MSYRHFPSHLHWILFRFGPFLVPLLNPKFAREVPQNLSELRVRGTRLSPEHARSVSCGAGKEFRRRARRDKARELRVAEERCTLRMLVATNAGP
jgi:hypothetical protein